MPISHPNVKGYYFVLEYLHGTTSQVMVVETDLHLNSAHPGFNAGAVDDLLAAAVAFMAKEAPNVPNVRIVSTRKYDVKA